MLVVAAGLAGGASIAKRARAPAQGGCCNGPTRLGQCASSPGAPGSMPTCSSACWMFSLILVAGRLRQQGGANQDAICGFGKQRGQRGQQRLG